MDRYQMIGLVDCIGRLKVKAISTNGTDDTVHVGFCSYLYVTDYLMSTYPNYEKYNWENGFGDVYIKPFENNVMTNIKLIDKNQKLYLSSPFDKENQFVEICPRIILNRAINKLKENNLKIKIGVELEFYILDQSNDGEIAQIVDYDTDYDYNQLQNTFDVWSELREILAEADITCDSVKCEAGRGQVELTILYDDPLKVADDVIIAKHMIKAFFSKRGKVASFMAKPYIDDASSGMHLHVSIHDLETNIPIQCSNELPVRFMRGILDGMKEWMCFYAPNINSYKRLRANSWVPVDNSIKFDNRTTAIRIVNDAKGHFEFRLPGADANIYMAITALIYSGISGIKDSISTEMKTYDLIVPFHKAIEYFSSSTIIQEALSYNVHSHYLKVYENEVSTFQNSISDFEHRRYLKNA